MTNPPHERKGGPAPSAGVFTRRITAPGLTSREPPGWLQGRTRAKSMCSELECGRGEKKVARHPFQYEPVAGERKSTGPNQPWGLRALGWLQEQRLCWRGVPTRLCQKALHGRPRCKGRSRPSDLILRSQPPEIGDRWYRHGAEGGSSHIGHSAVGLPILQTISEAALYFCNSIRISRNGSV